MKINKITIKPYHMIILCCVVLGMTGCDSKETFIPVERESLSMVLFGESVQESISQKETTLPSPGNISMENLLLTALEPVGRTMYVWGGGWNEEDTGAGIPALSFGVSTAWGEFAKKQDSTYNYKETEYQINDGLDCSGYIGWLIYNVFETKESTVSTDGYVFPSSQMAEKFAEEGWGECISASAGVWKPGDICSMPGHVWLSLGMCEDGSVVVLHASPPGVRLCGTRLANGEKSEAVQLAEEYMEKHYPEWYAKYPACDVSYNYLTKSKVFRWSAETMTDVDDWENLSAEDVLKNLYENTKWEK